MPDFDVQIHSYFESTTRRVNVDDLLTDGSPVVPPVTLPRPSVRRGLLVAAAAAVVVITALAGPPAARNAAVR